MLKLSKLFYLFQNGIKKKSRGTKRKFNNRYTTKASTRLLLPQVSIVNDEHQECLSAKKSYADLCSDPGDDYFLFVNFLMFKELVRITGQCLR